jgi:CheY-like chemotaxis protein
MNLSSLLVCAEESSIEVLKRVLKELGIGVELCADPVRGFIRLAQEQFDLLIVDCEMKPDVMTMLKESRAARGSESTLAVAVVTGQERVREMFALGVNFVLYKPVSYERALSSLRAAQGVLYRDKRRKARAAVHTQAVIDYAGVEQARATLVDLAEDGVGVNYAAKLPPACKVYFQFQLPGLTASVRLSGQVIWQDWNGRAGIQFVDVPQASRKVLGEWLSISLAEQAHAGSQTETAKVEGAAKPGESKDGLAHSGGRKGDLSRRQATHDALARLRSESSNRRGETRYVCRIGAEVYQRGSSVRSYCHISDLSVGGCYLEMTLAFDVNVPVEVVVRTHEMKLKLSGVVKSSHPGYGMGISFHLNTKDERRGVQQLIDYVAAAAESAG